MSNPVLDFFGFSQLPFSKTLSPKQLFLSTGASKRLFYRLIPELSKQPVTFIDDAQEMKEPALLALKSMTNFASDSQHRISFVLCG